VGVLQLRQLTSMSCRRCRVHKKYEEVFVPAVKKGVPPPGERRVLIAELPDWAQLPFEGYEYACCAHRHRNWLS
jgi:hypothetical protein